MVKQILSAMILFCSCSSLAQSLIGVNTSVYGAYGTAGNSIGSVPSRTMEMGGATLLPGIRLWKFLVGPFAEYQYVSQTTNPNNVSGQNISGQGYLLGPGLVFALENWKLQGGYSAYGSFNLTETTSGEATVTYSSPYGFFAGLGYRVGGPFFLEALFFQTTYSSSSTSQGTTNTSTTNVNYTFYGLGFSILL